MSEPIPVTTLGNFVAPDLETAETNGAGKRLATLHRTELCVTCRWPDTCEKDQTCWKEEARLEKSAPKPQLHVEPVPCKTAACNGTAESSRGRWARLCPACIEQRKEGRKPSLEPAAVQAAEQPVGGRMTPWSKEEILATIQRWNVEYGAPPTSNEWTKSIIGYPTCSTVIKWFGSWAEAIEQAGFPRPVRGGQASKGQQPPVVWRVKVPGTGLVYRTPEEAYVAAAEIDEDGERVADGFRHDGNEARAEEAIDRSRELAEKVRAAAAATEEPDGKPAVKYEESHPEPMLERSLELRVDDLPLPTLEGFGPGRAQYFVDRCNEEIARYEQATVALRQIVAGVQALEELSS